MLRHTKVRALAALTSWLMCFAAGPVDAACTNGNEGDIVYNKDYHTYQYCNGTSWVSYGGGIGSGAMSFISTQTASSSASLQWTSIGSYNFYQLICSNLVPTSNSATLDIQFGEGGGPTWKTANYEWATEYGFTTGGGLGNAASSSDVGISPTSTIQNTGQGATFTATLGGLAAGESTVTFQTGTTSGGGLAQSTGSGFYVGDTNPITAIRVLFTVGGNIVSGKCSLYGMN